MKFLAWSIVVAVFGILGMVTVFASPAAPAATPPSARIAHGKYVVESVAMCVDSNAATCPVPLISD